MDGIEVLDIERLRADTPGVTDHIHFNNAGASLPSASVLERQIEHLRLEARIGGYRAAREVAAEVASVRSAVATLLGASPTEIALHQSATDAWNMAILAIVPSLARGTRLVVDRAVYGSHAMALLQLARRFGLEVTVAEDDSLGQIDVERLRLQLEQRPVGLVCATHVPTSSGLVNPIEAVGSVCRQQGTPLVVDACQSVGQCSVDVERIHCAALSATGRKYLRGPRGTGFLYVRRSAFQRFVPLMPDLRAAEWTAPEGFRLHPDALRYETWERSVAGDLGLGVAVRQLLAQGVMATSARIQLLAVIFRRGLAAIDGVDVCDRGERLCGICTFRVAGMSSTKVAESLHLRGIRVSVTHATSAQLDLGTRGLDSVVRASVHAYNTEEEIEQVLAAVKELAKLA